MQAPDMHPVAAVIVGLLVLFGSTITVLGTIGLLRLKTFYERVHPPTLGFTMGTASLVLATVIAFAGSASGPVVNVVLVLVFVTLTTPVTMMLLARAALFRDRSKAFDLELGPEVVSAAQQQAAELRAAQAEAARHDPQDTEEFAEDLAKESAAEQASTEEPPEPATSAARDADTDDGGSVDDAGAADDTSDDTTDPQRDA